MEDAANGSKEHDHKNMPDLNLICGKKYCEEQSYNRDAAIRNGADAVKLAEDCARLTATNNGAILDTLAAAYAEVGKFAAAVTNAQLAINLATAQGDTKSATEIRARLEAYKSGRPYRE